MDTTLTERYLAAATGTLPPTAQDDVRDELKASIDDAVETRVEQGEERPDAERAVLTELGDPAVLAARFADRPLHLIGPRYYLTWLRLLKLLLAIVPACVVGGVALGQALSGAPIGQIVAQPIAAGLSAAVQVCFWVTVVFAILERTGADTGVRWDVDKLPEPRPTGAGRGDLVTSLVFLGLGAGAILLDRQTGLVRVGGESLSFFHPELWPWAMAGLLALIGLEALLAIAVFVRGRWTTALAVVNTALGVLFVSWVLTVLGRGLLVDPALVDVLVDRSGVGRDTLHTLGVLVGVAVVGTCAWDVVDGWRKARRDAR